MDFLDFNPLDTGFLLDLGAGVGTNLLLGDLNRFPNVFLLRKGANLDLSLRLNLKLFDFALFLTSFSELESDFTAILRSSAFDFSESKLDLDFFSINADIRSLLLQHIASYTSKHSVFALIVYHMCLGALVGWPNCRRIM